MSRRGFWFDTSMGVILFMLFMGMGLPRQSHGEDKITIGVVNCLSGFGADMGQGGRQGATIAAEEINAAGGVKGKKIEFIYRDDETNPQKGVSAVNELLFKQGVKVIMGTNVTNVANAVNKIINDQKVLFVTIASGKILVNPSEYPYTFRLNVSTDKEAIALVKHMVEKVNAKKIGIIRDSTAFGQTGLASVMDALKPYKIEPVAVEIYNPGDTDMTSQLLKLKNAGAEQVIAWGMGPDLVPVTNSFARIGWHPYIASGIGATQISFFQLARKDVADKWVTTIQKAFTYPRGGKLDPEPQKFVDKLKVKYGLDNKAYIMNAGIWYDMIRLYALAYDKVGSQDPTAIKAFIEGTSKYDGLVSKYSFSKTNHDGFNIADMAVASTIRGDVFTRERVD